MPKGLRRALFRVSAFDAAHGWESIRLSFIVNRPAHEPGFFLDRT